MSAVLLQDIGRRVRRRRRERGWTLSDLARRSGLSLRFVGQLERGQTNISVSRLAEVAEALDARLAWLVDPGSAESTSPAWIALLGVRGAGKSTVGAALAVHLGVPFIELDRLIEETAGLSMTELFSIHGGDYYREVEYQVLTRLLSSSGPGVIATGGSLVTHPESWSLLRSRARTVWLKADAKDHWNRVLAQGDDRPMRSLSNAFEQLEALLASRRALYREAELAVDTSGHHPEAIVERLASVVGPPNLG